MTKHGRKGEGLDTKRELLRDIMAGANVAMMVHLGRTLKLYDTLKDAGPVTSEDLANRSGLHERWLREWLHGQAAARIIEYRGDGCFELSAASATILADENHLMFMGQPFDSLGHRMKVLEDLPNAFRTGMGLSWDDRGSEAVALTESAFRNWYRQVLVQDALPQLDGAVAQLESGCKVADVGCGGGVALIEMAKAHPRSQFHGYEISKLALERAVANRDEAGAENVVFHNVSDDPLPADQSFDLITTFDCLHDMAHPHRTAAAIRSALSPNGLWFIVDIDSGSTFEDNLKNPMAPTMYAGSILSCMSSGLSEPDGAGLGTLGLPEPAMRQLAEAAGFTRFRRIDLIHPVNAYYEARP